MVNGRWPSQLISMLCRHLVPTGVARHTAIVELLLKRKAGVNATCRDGSTALHHAVRKGYLNVVSKLIAAKANVNKPDKAGETPLAIAKARKDQKMQKLLIMHGAKN